MSAADIEPPQESWLDHRIVVRPSPIHGVGLFAAEPIRGGHTVAVLGGRVISDGVVRGLIASGRRYDGIALGRDRNLVIAPRDWPGRHGNHSCEPNLWMAGMFRVVAAHDIAAGEELTIDYAMHTTDPDWQMACRCAAQRCRLTVRGDDWRIRDLQRRYRGRWPPVIAQLIAAEARSN